MLVNAAQLRLRTLEQQLNGDEESEGLPSPQHSPLPSPRLEHLRHPQMVDRKSVTLKEAPSSGLPSPHGTSSNSTMKPGMRPSRTDPEELAYLRTCAM